MKKVIITLLVSTCCLMSCNKEEYKSAETKPLFASVKFTAPTIGKHYNEGVDSLKIEVEGQHIFTFKTYLHQCNSISLGFMMKSNRNIEVMKFVIKADGKVVENGFISFREREERLIK